MKQYTLVVCLIFLVSIPLYSQQKNDSVADVILYSHAINDTSKTGNDRQNWSGFVSGAFDLTATDGKGNLTLSSTLWGIKNLINILKNDTLTPAEKYRKQWFIRNFAINASFSPDNKNQFTIDDGTIGFKYAIFNNRVASPKDYKEMAESILSTYDTVEIYMVGFKYRHTTDTTNLQKFLTVAHDTAYLSKELDDSLRSQFKLKGDIRKIFVDKKIEDQIQDRLSHKILWTISCNDKYDFQKAQTNNIVVSSEVTFYPFPGKIKEKMKKVPFDFSISETWAVDTTNKFANFNRQIFEVDFGKNIAFSKKFEVKPSFGYVHTNGTLYKKEKEDKADGSLTFRFKISDQFWLPITLKFESNAKKAQFFGFLSIQYSLK